MPEGNSRTTVTSGLHSKFNFNKILIIVALLAILGASAIFLFQRRPDKQAGLGYDEKGIGIFILEK